MQQKTDLIEIMEEMFELLNKTIDNTNELL